jgi:hypothetical protein
MILESSKNIYKKNGYALRDAGRGPSQKRVRMGFLVLAGLGMMIFLLSGCGSDSTPKPAASGKKEKAARSASAMQPVTPLLSPKAGGTAPPLVQLDKIGGIATLDEIEAKRKEQSWEKLDPNTIVFPGMTKEQVEAKIAAHQARKPDPNQEIFPGMSAKQLRAKEKAYREQRSTMSAEIFPGVTREQLKAKADQARQEQENNRTRPEQMFAPNIGK